MSDQLRHEWITGILTTLASVRARQVQGIDARAELQSRLSAQTSASAPRVQA